MTWVLMLLLGGWLGGALATAFWLEPEDMYGSRWDALWWPLAVIAWWIGGGE